MSVRSGGHESTMLRTEDLCGSGHLLLAFRALGVAHSPELLHCRCQLRRGKQRL
jgi:hypothetical protein